MVTVQRSCILILTNITVRDGGGVGEHDDLAYAQNF